MRRKGESEGETVVNVREGRRRRRMGREFVVENDGGDGETEGGEGGGEGVVVEEDGRSWFVEEIVSVGGV